MKSSEIAELYAVGFLPIDGMENSFILGREKSEEFRYIILVHYCPSNRSFKCDHYSYSVYATGVGFMKGIESYTTFDILQVVQWAESVIDDEERKSYA